MAKRNTKTTPARTAKTADKHALYQEAVQCVEADIDFVERIFKKTRKRVPVSLKEDFCGTAAAAAEFVQRRKGNTAIGVDLDKDVLAWGEVHNRAPLGARAKDLTLHVGNVLDVRRPHVDVVLAMNFSYFLFRTRKELHAYFANMHASLHPDGMAVLDLYGGWEAQQSCWEERKKDGFTYVWEQHAFNPIDSEAVNHIHFEFPDGSTMKRAFSYHWRLWTLREVTELLEEVGFRNVAVYWEGWDEEAEEGDGLFRKRRKAENCEGWIAYVTAER